MKSKKWEGPENFDTAQEGVTLSPKYNKFQPDRLTNYTVKLNFKIEGYLLDIRFCDKYSWILDLAKPFNTGVYRIENINEQALLSKFDYSKEPMFKKLRAIRVKVCPQFPHYMADSIQLILKCDLIEKTVTVYLDNKFCEKVNLIDGKLDYSVSVRNYANTRIFLEKMQICDNQGKVYFEADSSFDFPYKTVSRIVFFFGLLMLAALFFRKKGFFIRFLSLITILLLMEAYLRTTEKSNPYLNIHVAKADWDVEGTTNLFRNYNNSERIEICNLWRKKYPIAKLKDSLRIVCLGSSPVEGNTVSSDDKLFSAVLEKELNKGKKSKAEVINAGMTGYSMNDVKEAIYFSEVLVKFGPDLVIIYSDWWGPDNADLGLYKRMRELLKDNSGWITDQRMLRMALEFKYPLKEIVYLYNALCESYLFMGTEYIREKILNQQVLVGKDPQITNSKSEFCFEKILDICKERNIKILLIPQFDFIRYSNNKHTFKIMQEIQKQNKNVYFLSMEEVFLRNKEYLLSTDFAHLSEYGHKVMAEEIYNKLMNEGLISGYPD